MNSRVFVALGILVAASSTPADTFTLNPVADLRINSFSPTLNDNSEGLSTFTASGNEQRTLIQFDYSSLAGLNIISATLRLRGKSFNNLTIATSIDIFRVASAWSESQATWNARSTGNNWSNPGGDAVGTTGVQLSSPYTHWVGNETNVANWFEFDATSVVSAATAGQFTNNGLLLVGAPGNDLVFGSREGHTFGTSFGLPTEVPELVVQTQAVPEPTTLLVLSCSAVSILARRRKKSSA